MTRGTVKVYSIALLYCLHFALYREMNKNQGLELVLVLSFAVVRLILTLLTVDTNPGRPGTHVSRAQLWPERGFATNGQQ